LDAAVVLFRKEHFQTILVSGATGKEGVPEGTAMKRYLVASGIPDSAVIVDDQGVDTYASAQNTAAMLQSRQWKSVFVITQFYHVPRSKLALSKFGISPIYHAHARYFEARDIYSIMREIPAYLSYLLRPAQEK
jgi:uncharacterized SAM-binding protein YcdF (DUF218 family)